MRLIIMYDLNMDEAKEKKEYLRFRVFLKNRGYIMMQYSVYMKILNTVTKVDYEIKAIKKFVPKNGNIRTLTITDKQYHSMQLLRGVKSINETINTEKRRVVIKRD